jgi:hypothetical protein
LISRIFFAEATAADSIQKVRAQVLGFVNDQKQSLIGAPYLQQKFVRASAAGHECHILGRMWMLPQCTAEYLTVSEAKGESPMKDLPPLIK